MTHDAEMFGETGPHGGIIMGIFVLDTVRSVQLPAGYLHIPGRVDSQLELLAALVALHKCDVLFCNPNLLSTAMILPQNKCFGNPFL